MSKPKWWAAGLAALALTAGAVWSQSTVRNESVVWNFVNGFRSTEVSTQTGGTFTVKRSDAGTVTVTAADDDATAALAVVPGGAAALTLGGSAATSVTVGGAATTAVTISADGAQNADLVVPANSIGGGEVSGVHMDLIFCGQADENGTIYLSPAAGVNNVDLADGVDYSISGTACDGLDGGTEATQDLIVFPDVALKVMGMYCKQVGAEALGSAETVVFNMRSAAADTTPAITCTISEAESGCRSLTGSTTNIAAGATMAVKAVMTSNNSDQDLWCSVSVMLQ